MNTEHQAKAKILIVDDKEANLLALDSLLSKSNFDVLWAGGGKAAIDIARTEDLALIILDIQMPEMDGFETTRILKENPKTSSIPIILATAGEHERSQELRAYELGAADVIYKPIEPIILEAKVKSFTDIYLANQASEVLRKSKEAVQASETSLVDTLESMSDAFFSLDKDWNITRVNKRHEEIVRMKREDQIGKNFLELFLADPIYENSTYLKSYRKAMKERVEVTFEDYYEALNIWTEVRVYPKSDGGLAVFFTEISKRKKQEQTIAQMAQQLKTITNALPVLISYLDKNYHYKFVNLEYEKWFNIPHESLVGKHVKDLVGENVFGKTKPYMDRALNGEFVEFEQEVHYPNGSRHIEVSYIPDILEVNGKVQGIITLVRDITQIKKTTALVAESRERYKLLFQSSPLPKWIFDIDTFDFLDVNDAAIKHYGYSREEFLKMKVTDVRPPEDVGRFEKTMREDHVFDKTYSYKNFRHIKKDGSIIYVDPSTHDLILDGRKARVAAIVDVTEKIKNEKRLHELMVSLTEAKEEAEKANQVKSAFLANMSHEIRTPLGAIMGFVDLMKQPSTDREDLKNYVSIISRNSDQLLRIIDDILDLSKVEAGMMQIENIPFSLPTLISDFSMLMGLKAREKGISFKTTSATEIPEQIISDPVRLKQILSNCVGNAIKFTDKGQVHLDVSFESPYLIFKVEDTGTGISKSEQEKLFQPFSQADISTTRKYGGTGLGLVLTKKLAQAFGGNFWLEKSETGRGSLFIAKVKVHVPHESQLVTKEALTYTQQAVPEVAHQSLGQNKTKVLLVEDAPDNQRLIQIYLNKAGCDVTIASDGSKGVEKALQNDFDLVLMDIQMPHMDGHQATRALRAQGYQKPIIALTAHAMREERERTIASGFTDFLSKPINKEQLFEAISKYRSPL